MLADAGAVPQLVRHDEWDWHLHAVGPERDLPTRIVVETAMAMIDVIRADEMSRLGVCADDTCDGVVLDLSRNRSKRFCSTDVRQPQRGRGVPGPAAGLVPRPPSVARYAPPRTHAGGVPSLEYERV